MLILPKSTFTRYEDDGFDTLSDGAFFLLAFALPRLADGARLTLKAAPVAAAVVLLALAAQGFMPSSDEATLTQATLAQDPAVTGSVAR